MAVSFTNVPSGILVPLFYAELDNSAANTAQSTLVTLLIGQMTAGKAEALKPVLVSSAAQGYELFGHGSQLGVMNAAYRANNTVGEVWAIPLADPSGTKASATVTFTGTPTEAGTVSLYVNGHRVQAGVALTDTVTEIAANVSAAVNAQTDLPVTASASSGVVTFNAKNAGLAGNDFTLTVNLQGYAAGEVLPEGIAAEATGFSGGTGTPDLAAAIKAMGEEQYDLIAVPYSDAGTLTALAAEMNDASGRWSPMRQLYGHVFTVARGDASALQAVGSGRNNQHETIVGLPSAVPSAAIEVLGAYVGRAASALNNDPARPLQTLELQGITAAPAGSRFNLSERQTLLSSGISTLYTKQGGTVAIERAVTTYQTNSYGSDDNSYLDVNTLFTLAYILRDLKSVITSKYPRHKLASDGTHFGSGQAVVTPSLIRAELIAEYGKLEDAALVEDLDTFKSELVVERDASDPNRVNVLLPPNLVNQLRIFAVLTQFRLN
nr:MAG TPA: tail component [Caudoviricetes sp.]